MKIIELQNKITYIICSTKITEVKLQEICNLLKNEIKHFNWVGFYFTDGNKEELKLVQFSGKPTEHTIIPFGKGI